MIRGGAWGVVWRAIAASQPIVALRRRLRELARRIEQLTGQVTLETTVSDGLNRSNVIRTTCTPGGACFSG